MIDTTKTDWGIVEHSLPADYWHWEKLNAFVENKIQENPDRYTDFGNGGFNLSGMDADPLCKNVLNFLLPLKPTFYARAELYAGIRDDSKSFGPHIDPGQHLWIWQIIGNTPWMVEDTNFLLKENQMLYIPPGLKHCALPNAPRASITFSLEEYDE